ncbi:MAG: hypothetical protein NZ992_05670 [Candidatus Korarchaeum sp.]|nr:hypothetical protein [Candidatus Korarchaeum sp.]MDW8035830.1 hypothetical protein [Candidatus Korarchaeum sp.]
MSLLEELSKELEENPKLARELAKKILGLLEPELSLTIQIKRLVDQINLLAKEQIRLREDFNREITRIWEEIRSIKEEQARTWKAIEGLQRSIWELDRKIDHIYEGLSSSMIYVFGELRKFAGLTFEEFVRVFLTYRMRRAGEIPISSEFKSVEIEKEQIDLFLEDPLIVGEVTTHAESVEEVDKLLRKAKVVAEKFGREPKKLLVVETAPKEVARELRRRADEAGVELILGKEV